MAEILIPKDNEGRDLSPFEAKTGVVLPIWAPGDGKTNRHHAHFYRRHYINGPRKTETRAVRFSRLQRARIPAHDAYHRAFEGTAFPVDETKSFGLTILNVVRYIPSHVVDMSGSNPVIVETTPKMKRVLLSPGIITTEKRRSYRKEIGQFLMYHAISQNFDHVKRSQVEQFIELGRPEHKNDELALEQRFRIGIRLANIGLGLAVDGIDKVYHQAREEKALPSTAPVCAWQVAKDIVEGFEPDYFGDLEHNLINQFGMAA